jgi:hypothetical protein
MYHVGTCGISAILVTSPEGHLLIHGGTERGGELVASSIRALGLSLGDVRYLTHTQEHGDHIGGLEYLKDSPGAISWQWEECEGSQCRTLVFTDGLAPFAADRYRWTDDPEYLAAYRESVTWLQNVEVDICLAAHPSQVRLIERIESGTLIDPDECRRNGAFTQGRIDIIVARERGW